jgi:site-specific DNA-adenine methylase
VILNLSYDQVPITTPIAETIVYLDPPYETTAKYQKTICHRRLEDYVKSSPYKIYLSSYECPDGMHEVLSMEHRSILAATANIKVVEKLFCNRQESVIYDQGKTSEQITEDLINLFE